MNLFMKIITRDRDVYDMNDYLTDWQIEYFETWMNEWLGGDGDSYCDSEASLDDSCYKWMND